MAELVSMFKCKQCGTRLYERDCAGHLERHGLKVAAARVLDHFEMGPRTASSRPGDQNKPLYYTRGAKKAADDDAN